jgi:glycosyltransferase involved in cell wall biosynthesis
MKITIVTGAFFPVPPTMGGAVEKAWFTLAQEFARRGHEVVLVSRKVPEVSREEILGGVRHLRVRGFDTPRSLLWLKFLDLIYSIRAMSILPQADVIVTNTFWLPIFLRDSSRGKVYVHVARYPKGQMRFYGKAARLQAPSHAVARAIAAEAPRLKHKIAVVPYPAPGSTTKGQSPPISGREKIVLYVGRVHPEKGVHLLVKAFADKARTLFADWRLMIIGPTEEKFGGGGQAYLASLKRSASNEVTFAGAVFEARQLEQHFRAAQLLIYPSLAERGESFGLAPLEAMAHGCAVLVSNLDCFHDFIRDRDTGFIFNHRAKEPVDTLREKIENVIVDERLLARVAEAGYRKSAEYSLEHVAARFLADFESVMGNSNA